MYRFENLMFPLQGSYLHDASEEETEAQRD